MRLYPWKSNHNVKFDVKVLRKNDISLLILDERWNKLFTNIPKSPAIERCEHKLKELLKEESRLLAEQKEIAAAKKLHMDKIIKLTPDVYEKNDKTARNEMQFLRSEIKRINERTVSIEKQLEDMPKRIKQANLELLEHTVSVVYLKIRNSRKRVEELGKLIDETKAKLMEYINEKELLSQVDADIYSYFHDLIGAEELERLDKELWPHNGP